MSLISFLGKRFKRFFSSGQKIPTSKFRWLALVGLLCVIPWNGVEASADWAREWNAFGWDPEAGVITYRVRYFQTWGGDGDGNCGFSHDSDCNNKANENGGFSVQQHIYVNGGGQTPQTIDYRISCNNDGGSLAHRNIPPNRGNQWFDDPGIGKNEGHRDIVWNYEVTTEQLNKQFLIHMDGIWWRRWDPSDQRISEDFGYYTTTVSMAEYKQLNSYLKYDDNGDDFKIALEWSREIVNRNCATFGTVYLRDSDNNTLITGPGHKSTITEGVFELKVDNPKDYLKSAHKYYVYQVYQPYLNSGILYETKSPYCIVKASPQVESFSVSADNDNRRVLAKWEIPTAPSADYDDSPFIVTMKKALNDEKIKDTLVEYIPNTKIYECSLDLADGDTATYYFQIERKGWPFKENASVKVSTGHNYPLDIKAELYPEANPPYVSLSWTKSGNLWSEGTVMKVKRTNLTSAKIDEWELGYKDYDNQKFRDDLLQPCSRYVYSVSLIPGGSYPPMDTTVYDTLKLSEVGSVSDFVASKGYYSEKVNLTWKVLPEIDEVLIERREYGKEDAPFKLINNHAISSASDYTYDDVTGVPGLVYEYRICGMKICDKEKVFVDTLSDIGYRTPTGDFYGHVTFENGQAVDSVRVRLSAEDVMVTYALGFDGNGEAVIPGSHVLTNNEAASLQAWVYSNASSSMVLIRKEGMYELGLNNDHVYFVAGNDTLTSEATIVPGSKAHVTAVYGDSKLQIYIDGELVVEKIAMFGLPPVESDVVLGEHFRGYMDEVRLWSRVLSPSEIANDYMRYLVGNEKGLDAYYTFNFMTDNHFYDSSYEGMNDYHENTGTLNNVQKKETFLNINDLTYCGVTDSSGVYNIRSVPYYGNGTAYTMIPSKGSHQFSPKQEIRLIGEGAQHHTVNFTDNSSFDVSGIVVYEGGTYPVEGVHFTVDGVAALDKSGQYIQTDAEGKFTIRVPVGIHEVKAVKNGHTFVLEGRICNSDGSDRNYQDIISGLKLYDNTKVKYIGRICGGTVQEAYPVGFSLSKNNLAKDMKVVLSSTKPAYELQSAENVHSKTIEHPILKGTLASGKKQTTKSTVCDYNEGNITIHVNNETGEFIAEVLPIEYKVNLNVYGHQDIAGDNSSLDLSSYAMSQYEKYEYKDSLFKENGEFDREESYTDSVEYRQKQVFLKQYRAKMSVSQVVGDNDSYRELSYFGSKEYDYDGSTKISLYNDALKTYTFGLPVFVMNEKIKLHYEIFEEYPYYEDGNLTIDDSKTDRVKIEGASVSFNNKLAHSSSLDTVGQIYEFQVDEPDLTTAKATIAATFSYGNSDNPTSVSWEKPLGNKNGEAYILGSHITGTDFVTAGPNKLLCVLRDPPGSNSYSYLEKGTSFTQSSTYNGAFNHEGSEMWTTGYKLQEENVTMVGMPGNMTGVVHPLIEVASGIKAGIIQEAEYTGSNSMSSSFTLTTRIQTSDDPSYVGADADLYIGYSTNLSFGSTKKVAVYPIDYYDRAGGDDYFEKTYAKTDSYVIAETSGISAIESFGTMFAYPQRYVEQTLVPNLKELRNSLILPMSEARDAETMKALAKEKKKNIYVSKVPVSDPSFGEKDKYDVYYYVGECDTINTLNQYISNWKKVMEENERIKLAAKEKKVLQNYSFQAGSNIEYSESYSSVLSSSHSFSVKLGVDISNDNKADAAGAYTLFEYEEQFSTTQGGDFESETEASHSKGFVLAEDGDDYLSVDVIREPILEEIEQIYNPKDSANFGESYVDWVNAGEADTSKLQKKDFYPTFVFITRGGATSCPYEGAYETKYYEKGKHVISAATKQMEIPKIDMPNKYIENVPSGEPAFLTVRMMNNSETGDDQVFDLRLMDASNPNGAVPTIDGNSMSGTALSYRVPAGEVLEKTLAVYKGSVLNYDHLKLILSSQCQEEIADTVDFTVHFIPSCSNVAIAKPSNNWTYNTNCATDSIDGVVKHYMPITISGFDVNYTDFEHIELQYKPASGSDNDWVALSYYYKDSVLAQKAVDNGFNAFVISSEDGGNLYYNFYMDNLPDQRYDIRAVSFCNINNQLYENPSEIVSGVKDMYNPRLFGTPKPADGVLSIEDDVRINFNETIAEGKLTVNNFEVTGVRNGAVTDHSVAIALDGENDYLTTEATRNFANKDLTFECWVNYDSLQNATFFSQGDANEAISMGMNDSGKVVVKVADKVVISENAPAWEKSSWNHVALVYDNTDTTVTAYVNYTAVVNATKVNAYKGNGVVEVGRNVASQSGNFNGKVDQFRIWNAVRSFADIQGNSTAQLSGNDLNLIAYYEMEEAKGSATEDKARGANLVMKGGSWALPEGRSAEFDGASYVAMNSSAAVITSDMDFTLEFWFNAVAGAKDQTILSNGNGIDKNGENPSKVFSVGFDEEGTITFRHNGYTVPVNGKYADNNWHNFTLAVNRSSGNARIYMDGELNTYFPAEKVGRIASDKLFAGARVWSAGDSTIKTVDQYFTGKVDEVRLWNLYRQQSQIEKFYNQKSNGDEMGLLLYYPFEHYIDWQGTAEMQFTLDDKGNDALDGDGNKLAFATKVGNVVESKNIPPVKTKGATASLLYDWVVNNDALIITLKEQDYRIEKTIVNFTVNKVQDVNGNYILSPITWSAYIDRNQLKWLDDAVSVNKKQNEAYEFEMPIVNKGGSIINYSLDNMPSWLSASSESGVINPLEKQTIKFEIDPSLAVGTYDEVVYLTNSNNVTEPLALNVTVEGNTPDWKVDPSKYEFSMAVFAQIKVDNQFSNDEKDMLAAFYEDECVGVAHMSYDKTLDMWYALLTVYSEKSSTHELTYRIWDASTGRMYKAVSSPTVKFVNNKVSGKPTEPIVFSNSERVKYQNILLNKGWNWVSFNLKSGNISNMDTYLKGGNWTANSFVKSINKSANYSPENAKWTNSGVRLNNVNMFKIYSDVEQTLAVSGSDLDLSSTEISLKKKGWTYIAYLPTYSMTLKAALADYEATEGDVIKSKEGFAMYYGNEWIGSLKSLQPNSGYMMKNMGGEVKKFKYPTASTALRSAAVVAEKASAYESNMSVIAYAPEKKEGDLLRVLVGNEENEVVEVALTDDYALQFINVSANAGDKVRFTMERDGVTYVANNSMSFAGDAVYGTPSEPYILNFNIDAAESLSVYPNPVVDLLNVSGALNGESEVTLELFDLAGALVYTKQVSVSDNALDASISMNGFAAGSYLLKVSQNGDSKMFKIVKK